MTRFFPINIIYGKDIIPLEETRRIIMARTSLSQQTAEKIHEMIKKQYEPGSRIPTESELVEFLNVSRTTVREAVKVLCSRNILEIRRGNGTFVKENPGIEDNPLGLEYESDEEMRAEMFEISEMMQPVLMAKAADKATDEDIAGVEEIHNRLLEDYARYQNGEFIKPEHFRKLDIEFHLAIISICRNKFADRMVKLYVASCGKIYDLWVRNDPDRALESFIKYHEMMMEALRNRDHYGMFRYALEHTKDMEKICREASEAEA